MWTIGNYLYPAIHESGSVFEMELSESPFLILKPEAKQTSVPSDNRIR